MKTCGGVPCIHVQWFHVYMYSGFMYTCAGIPRHMGRKIPPYGEKILAIWVEISRHIGRESSLYGQLGESIRLDLRRPKVLE